MRLVSLLLGLAIAAFVLWLPFMSAPMQESQVAKPRPESPFTKPLAQPPKESADAGSTKRNLLAREQAEMERFAALAEKDKAAKAQPNTKLYYRVTVRDGGSLEAAGKVIKLDGIKAREADAQCRDAVGKTWPCGAAARAALTRLIRSRAVRCTLPEGGEQPLFAARCNVAGIDLSAWMLRQGWVEATEPAPTELADAARAAKAERNGLWRAEMEQAQP